MLKTAKEEKERLTPEQRQNLAILHDDIDEAVFSFREENAEHIVFDITPPTQEGEKPKKPRLIYGLPKPEIVKGATLMENFLHRMLSITDDLVVRSVTNKLIHFVPQARRLTVSKTTSQRAVVRNRAFFSIRKKIIEEMETVSEDDALNLEAYTKILDFMTRKNIETINGRTYSDRVTFSAFDENEKQIATMLFFQGGVVVPNDCSIREPLERKSRNDKVEGSGVEIVKLRKENYMLNINSEGKK